MGLIVAKHKGLYTNPNELSAVPPGAMLQAANCVIDADDVLEPRRGNNRDIALPLPADRFERFAFFQSQRLAAWSNGKVGYKNGSTWTPFSGTYNNVDDLLARRRFLLSNNNTYFTSATGVFRLDTYNGTPVLAGMFKGLDVAPSLTGVSGFFAVDNQLAYRMLWGIKDANGNVIKGAASGRATIINPLAGGAKNVSISFTIPTGITTSHFYQVYRSAASGGESIEPSDEVGLVYESNPTSGEISAGVVTFTDITPDSLRGETLYSSASQQGQAQANERPPLCHDIELFQGCTFYANVTNKHRLYLTITGTDAPNGVQANDTITIAGITFTGKTAEDTSLAQFKVYTTGTPAQNVADTTASLIRCINRKSGNTSIYAYYLSGENDLPGQMLIEEQGIGGASFAAVASAHSGAYNPPLPTSGTSVSSSADAQQNVVMISKPGQADAVPLANLRRVGSANFPIRRIKKLRNTLFILKEHEGVFKITGTSPDNFAVDDFDSSAKILAPDTVAVVNNQMWFLADQGICTATETGVSVVSRPIEDIILGLQGSSLDAVRYYSHAVGYESDRKYILWTVANSSATYATKAFPFNVFTKTFTYWPLAKTTGLVSPDDGKLYLGDALTSWGEVERKTRTYLDYVEYGVDYTLTSSTAKTVILTTTNEIKVGDILWQSVDRWSLITAVTNQNITVRDTLAWDAGTITVFKSIECIAEYAAAFDGTPGEEKQFPEISMHFKLARFTSAEVSFATDNSPFFESQTLTGDRSGLWGLFPWGSSRWGGVPNAIPLRTDVPLEKQRGSYIRVKFRIQEGYGAWRMNGWTMPARPTGSVAITI